MKNEYVLWDKCSNSIRENIDYFTNLLSSILKSICIIVGVFTAVSIWKEYSDYNIYSRLIIVIVGIANIKLIWFLPVVEFAQELLCIKKCELIETYLTVKYIIGSLILLVLEYIEIVFYQGTIITEFQGCAYFNAVDFTKFGIFIIPYFIVEAVDMKLKKREECFNQEDLKERYRIIRKKMMNKLTFFKSTNQMGEGDEKANRKITINNKNGNKKKGLVLIIFIAVIVILEKYGFHGNEEYLENTVDKLNINSEENLQGIFREGDVEDKENSEGIPNAEMNNVNAIVNNDETELQKISSLDIPEELLDYTYMKVTSEEECLFSFNMDATSGLVVYASPKDYEYLMFKGKIQENENGVLEIFDEENGMSLVFDTEELKEGSLLLQLLELDYTIILEKTTKDEFLDVIQRMNCYTNVLEYDIGDFIGETGDYVSTSGGSDNCISMELYDLGNGYVNIIFKSIMHNGTISAQGKVIGTNMVEAESNGVHFSLVWTDAGEVTISRTGTTGYSDIDLFTEYETFRNNSYYQSN